MRRQAAFLATLLVPLWALALLGLAELGFRVVASPPRQIIALDDNLGWRYLPNVSAVTRDGGRLTTNSQGFRGPELAAGPVSGGPRVLALGDSYTAGMHVADDQIFTALLPALLGKGAETRNGAVPAWATDQQLLYYESEGAGWKPGLVLLVVAPNDLRESYAKGFFTVDESGKLARKAGAARLRFLDRLTWRLLNHSAAVQWLGGRFGFLDVFSLLSRYYRFSFPIGAHEATDHDLFLREEPPQIRKARELFEAIVLRLRDRTKANGSRLVVTVLPTLLEFSWPLIGSKQHEAGIVSKRVQRFAAREGIAFVDLAGPALEMGGDARTLFLDGDFHLNTKGHRFVAELLARSLLAKGKD